MGNSECYPKQRVIQSDLEALKLARISMFMRLQETGPLGLDNPAYFEIKHLVDGNNETWDFAIRADIRVGDLFTIRKNGDIIHESVHFVGELKDITIDYNETKIPGWVSGYSPRTISTIKVTLESTNEIVYTLDIDRVLYRYVNDCEF